MRRSTSSGFELIVCRVRSRLGAYLGDDNLLISTDYPHPDSLFPEAINTFVGLPGVSDVSKRKILWDNPARLFGLEDPLS